jgi:TRAP-type C4-dicarboxylate transport system substrate-binding protein
VSLVVGNFGNDVIFLRRRVDNFRELQKTPMWIWDADVLLRKQMTAMGLTMVPAAVDQLAGMYDAGQIDAMFVIPTAALAFQWATRAHYFIELRGSALAGCVTLSLRAFDSLSFAQQQVLRDAANRFGIRFEELGRREDSLLLGTTLERQGVKRLTASDQLRALFLEAARTARDNLDPRILPAEVLSQAQALLAEFRARAPKHGTGP